MKCSIIYLLPVTFFPPGILEFWIVGCLLDSQQFRVQMFQWGMLFKI
jgi:hypothetical protein